MKVKRISAPATFKVAGDTGEFEGYAAIFGNVDLGGDVVLPGAFKEIMTTHAGKVVVLLQHDSTLLPIGGASVEQDDKGLKFAGQLVMEDPLARRALAHMKAGTLTGMSIGYDVLPGGSKLLESGVRELSALKLWEVSPVIWGMNPVAGINSAKAADSIATITEFEKFLRDVGGFSHSSAKALASDGWKAIKSAPRDVATDFAATLEGIAAAAKNAASHIFKE